MADEHSPVVSTEFTGFANAPVGEDGTVVDFRDVEAFDDDSEEGRVRKASQTTPSSVVENKTEGPSTNGYPAATVPEQRNDAPEAPEESDEDADPAEGEEDADANGR